VNHASQDPFGGSVTRRELINRGLLAGGVVIGGGLLIGAGCGDSGGDSDAPPTEAEKGRGGTLRIGGAGGGAAGLLDPAKAANALDHVRNYVLYEGLFQYDRDFNLVPQLAEEMEANAAGDVWTVRLREGVTFHDGKPLRVEDVVFSISRAFDKSLGPTTLADPFRQAGIDIKNGVQKLDERTVRFTLKKPYAIFKEITQLPFVVPEGFDTKHPIGTGPFKFESFDPGERSVFVANPDWWGDDGPYVDELIINDINDPTARVNALLSGQVDVINEVPFSQIRVIEKDPNLRAVIQKSGRWQPMTMRVDQAPFDDVRVRQAFRMIVDRKEVVDQALSGEAQIANDLYARQDPCYADDIPQREQDLEQAQSLLKQAGQEGLTVELVAGPVVAGLVEMTEVFAKQAKEAGVNVELKQVEAGVLFGEQYRKWRFAVDSWGANAGYLRMAGWADYGKAAYNATHFNDPEFNALYEDAVATADDDRRCEMIHEMQRIQHDRGGYIIPYAPNTVDAATSKLVGWQEWSSGQTLNAYHLEQIAFAA
jgi:peptide/nickel transport system substrate-binding protein